MRIDRSFSHSGLVIREGVLPALFIEYNVRYG